MSSVGFSVIELCQSPLHRAVASGSIVDVKQLVAQGADLNSVEGGNHFRNCSALHVAVWQRDLPMVTALLDLGADYSLRCHVNGDYVGTAECFARARGYPEIANAIANANVDPMDAHKKCKASISTKLRKAREVKMKQEALRSEIQTAGEELRTAMVLKAKLTAALRLTEQKVKSLEERKGQAEERDALLASHPDGLSSTEMECLENTWKALSEEEAELCSDHIEADVLDCVVCLSPPSASAYTCQDCDHLMCHDCLGRLHTCPTCRVSFTDRPARRSRMVERMVEKMNAGK